jgi:hypothetical protein
VLGDGGQLLEAAGVALAQADVGRDPGLVQLDRRTPAAEDVAVDADDGELPGTTLDPLPEPRDVGRAAQAFLLALGRHRHYERERDPAAV